MGNSDYGTTYRRVGGDDGDFWPWHVNESNENPHRVSTTEGLRAVQAEGDAQLKAPSGGGERPEGSAGNAGPITTDGMWSKDDDRWSPNMLIAGSALIFVY